MQFVTALIIFFFSSGYVLLLSYIASTTTEMLRGIILPIVIMTILLVLFRPVHTSWKHLMDKWGKLFILFWGTTFVQLLVLSTGGLQSPFLILIYLFMVTISFIYSFSISSVFLATSLAIIFINISSSQNIFLYILQNPTFIILHLASLIPIIPLSFLISRQYHLKDLVFSALHTKIETDETILSHLRELIIITDTEFTILSLNDAVEQALQKSRSEILGHPFFNLILLRDTNGKLASKETFFPKGDITKKPQNTTYPFTLLLSSLSNKEVIIQIHLIKDKTNTAKQISFILTSTNTTVPSRTAPSISLEKAKTKYEALNTFIRQEILKTKRPDLITQTLVMQEIESDIYYMQLLQQYPTVGVISSIDIAKLVKHSVEAKKDFASVFGVQLNFSLVDFGEKDIAPLTVKKYPVKPEDLTGPFFSIKTDVRRFELLTKKLIDIAIFLSSDIQNAKISVSLKRSENNTIILNVVAACSSAIKDVLPNLFLPYYGGMDEITTLHTGSGFEGYFIKTTCDTLSYKLTTNYDAASKSELTFTVVITKNLTI